MTDTLAMSHPLLPMKRRRLGARERERGKGAREKGGRKGGGRHGGRAPATLWTNQLQLVC